MSPAFSGSVRDFSDDANPLVYAQDATSAASKFLGRLKSWSNLYKTIFTFFCLGIIHTFTGISLILTNAKRPALPLLPDTIMNLIPYMPLENYINILMIAMVLSEVVIIALDKRRCFIYRRTCAVYSILSILRILTTTSTFLPDPSPNCPAIHDTTIEISPRRVFVTLFGGLTCGDMIFSGHTMGFLFPGLVHHHFFGKKIGCVYLFLGLCGALCLVISRFHYTVDVLLSIILTPLMWFIYNLLCENPSLSKSLPVFVSRYLNFFEWSEIEETADKI